MDIERKGNGERDNEDRISTLPEFLIHQILSYLPSKEAARTTVLSSAWLKSYSTSPILSFNERFFVDSRPMEILKNRYHFFNFVKNTLLRYTSLNLRVQKLDITVWRVNRDPAYHLLDDSLGVAFDNGVQELNITIFDDINIYTLPSAMFDSPKRLTYLRVDQCKFPQNVVSNSKCSSINFPFLKTLIMYRARIDDGMLQKLLKSSPCLEKIVFFNVSGFKKFRVCNLGKLKILDINSDNMIEIDIEDAPSLHLLKHGSCFATPCLLEVGKALHSLKRLELYSLSISDVFLKVLITKCPLLEHLKIDGCNGLERINIVSGSLKHLNINGCKNIVEAEIDTPSLLEIEYVGENALSLSLNNTPEELMTCIHFRNFGRMCGLSDAWFCRLRELLNSVTRARVYFNLFCIKFDTTLDSRENPFPVTGNDMPEMNPSSHPFVVLVNTLFSNSRPTFIHSCSPEPTFGYFMKFLSSELITATRNPNCCRFDRTKCWRHYLKDIKVEVLEDFKEVWQPLHKEETLQSEFSFCDKVVRFSLEW